MSSTHYAVSGGVAKRRWPESNIKGIVEDVAMKLSASAGLTAIPATGLLNVEGDGFVSLCSPAGPYKEEGYWCEQMGFKIVDLGDAGNKVYFHRSVPEHDIHPDSVVAGGMPLRVLLLLLDTFDS